ncbi:MAG: Rhomboid family protein [Verrucomicrobiales bacterium]|nr:Rhomboid family protein [Verrucomicrobiales bacterium]
MGVADRYYMRDEYHAPHITTKLIIVLIVAFVIQSALYFYGDINAYTHLALTAGGLAHGKVWQLFTFQFLHSVPMPWHVLINCFGLYFFGRRVEETLGAKRFLTVYLLAGAVGGLLQAALTMALPRHPDYPVVGASAGVYGIMAIFCTQHPMDEIRTFVYFFPITVRAYVLLLVLGLFALYGAIVPYSNVANGAHLGGLLFGIFYVRKGRMLFENLADRLPFLGRRDGKSNPLGSLAKHSPRASERAKGRKQSTVFVSDEVDPILDKISSQGIDSLTDHEREILEKARKKMR